MNKIDEQLHALTPHFSVARVLAFVAGGYVVPALLGSFLIQALFPVQGAMSIASYAFGACPYVLVFAVSALLLRPCFGVTLSWFIAGARRIRVLWLVGGFFTYAILALAVGMGAFALCGASWLDVVVDAGVNTSANTGANVSALIGLLILAFVVALFQAASEELYFRCLLIRWLFPVKSAAGKADVRAGALPSGKAMIPAVVLTAVVFALFHGAGWLLGESQDVALALVRYAAMGAFLAWLACYTGSFELPIAVHAAHNVAALALTPGPTVSFAISPVLQVAALTIVLGISVLIVWRLKVRGVFGR